jgi:iron complex transport system ATP-binding protein
VTVLAARDVVVYRGEREVVRGVSLEVEAGEALALVGPNAAGKSTLLRAMVGLLPLASGVVEVLGRPLADWPGTALARQAALVGAEDEGAGAFTVRERVALGRYPHLGPFRPTAPADEAAVDDALRRTGIAHLAARRVETLSAGERQLAALARGLAQQPRLLLLDEPAAHLDIGHQLALFRVLDEARADGVAVLAVVHDLQRAASWAGRMLLFHEGRVAADGSPAAVLLGKACADAFGVEVTAHGPGLLEFREARRSQPPGEVRLRPGPGSP